jgi:acetyl esterase
MPIDPLAQAFLDSRAAAGSRPVNELTVDAARAQAVAMSALLGPGEPIAQVSDRTIPSAHGDIPIRTYVPAADSAPFPILVYFHGGGWVVGNLETSDVTCRQLANGGGCVVVSVNYRHAPEHTFPAAPEDAYAATQWISQHASAWKSDPNRLAVGGASAGGNIAAVVTLMARERGGPQIKFQLLTVPVTDFNLDTPSYRANAEGYGLTREAMRWYWNHYVRLEADGASPSASPLRAADLHGLPPGFVMTAEFDPLHDEGVAYANRLRAAGVPVTHKCYAGMIHGFLGPEAPADMARELRAAFSR